MSTQCVYIKLNSLRFAYVDRLLEKCRVNYNSHNAARTQKDGRRLWHRKFNIITRAENPSVCLCFRKKF